MATTKIKMILVAMFGLIGLMIANAKDTYSTDVNVLPKTAQTAVSTHFPKNTINHIKIDKDFFGIDGYDVVLNDGTEIDFDSNGNITEVDCGAKGAVPASIVMKPIRDYVAANYKGQNIIKYEVKRGGYEVELSSGIDLVFNQQGVFQKIDR